MKKITGFEIKLSPEKSEEYFYNALCNGLSYMSGYGLRLDFSEIEYKISRNKLTSPCLEDVFMQMLRDGYKLTLIDEECEGEYTRSIGLKEVHDRVQKTDASSLINVANENDDADTADAILQTVFFEDIIFG